MDWMRVTVDSPAPSTDTCCGPGKVVVLTIPRTIGTAEKSICAPAFLQASPGLIDVFMFKS
jgi:hypothetical protein